MISAETPAGYVPARARRVRSVRLPAWAGDAPKFSFGKPVSLEGHGNKALVSQIANALFLDKNDPDCFAESASHSLRNREKITFPFST
jgi:hypothetical protein